MHPELQNYIKQARLAGKGDDVIRKELATGGWTPEDISQALNAGSQMAGMSSMTAAAAKGSSMGTILTIMALVVLVAGAGGYFYLNKTSQSNLSDNENTLIPSDNSATENTNNYNNTPTPSANPCNDVAKRVIPSNGFEDKVAIPGAPPDFPNDLSTYPGSVPVQYYRSSIFPKNMNIFYCSQDSYESVVNYFDTWFKTSPAKLSYKDPSDFNTFFKFGGGGFGESFMLVTKITDNYDLVNNTPTGAILIEYHVIRPQSSGTHSPSPTPTSPSPKPAPKPTPAPSPTPTNPTPPPPTPPAPSWHVVGTYTGREIPIDAYSSETPWFNIVGSQWRYTYSVSWPQGTQVYYVAQVFKGPGHSRVYNCADVNYQNDGPSGTKTCYQKGQLKLKQIGKNNTWKFVVEDYY